MSWGALNNQRERKSADPLPDFLTERDVKSFNDRNEAQPMLVEEVLTRKSERPYTSRTESSRGYGASYSRAIEIRLSKKTFFMLVISFTAAILMAFCIGYAMGGSSNTLAPQASNSISLAPIKKPIVPPRKKEVQASTVIEKTPKAGSLSTLPGNINPVEGPKNFETSSGIENNKDNNDGEAVYEEIDPSEGDREAID